MKNKLLLFITLSFLSIQINAQIGGFSDPIKLGSTINTKVEEAMPLLSHDKTTFYYTRIFDSTATSGYYDQEIWSSTLEDGNFNHPEQIKELNNKFHNAVLGISTDGETLYLIDTYGNKKAKEKGIAYSKKTADGWSKPLPLGAPTILNNDEFFGFHISKNEDIIIYSINGPGSIGGEDLYFSKKIDGVWSTPEHMGNIINSKEYEISPFLNNNNDTLFFASNGFGGVGNADVFYSIRLDDTWKNWSAPVNLGPKVNSDKYDAFFSLNEKTAYFTSNRDGGLCDIYSLEVLPPPPFDASMFKNLSDVYGEIDLSLKGPDEPYSIAWNTGETTEDLHNLKPGFYTAKIKDKYGRTVEVMFEIKEPPAPEKKKVNADFTAEQFAALFKNVNPIYFDVAKYEIRKDASKELDKIVKIMNDNPTLEIELGSHTDCQSSDELNFVLSHNRAKRSAEYIKERITKPERINGKGYGESQLKISCNCDATDLKSKCNKKDNQLNRRTEFIMKNENSTLTEDIGSLPYQTYDPAKRIKSNETVTKEIIKETKPTKVTKETKNETVAVTPSGPSETTTSGGTKFRTDIVVTPEQAENIKNGFYILSEGETLYRASINSKVPINEIRKLNNLKSNNVKPGTKLLLR